MSDDIVERLDHMAKVLTGVFDDVAGIAAAARDTITKLRADLASYREVFDAQKSVIGLLEDTLRKIKRENQRYNFGTKLVRLVDEALSRLPALTDEEQ